MKRLALLIALLLALTTNAHAQLASGKSHILSTASTNSTLVNGARTVLYNINVINTTTTVYYLKLYDKVTAPSCGTDTPVWTIPVPFGASNAGGGAVIPISNGAVFESGLGFCLVGGVADNDSSNAATGVVINLSFQGL